MSEQDPKFSRRDILKSGSSAALLPLASVLGLSAPVQRAHADARAIEFKSLDQTQCRLLLGVARTIFPHDFLPDAQYLKIVATIDARAAADQRVGTMVKAALAAFPHNFSATDEVSREDYLRTLAGSPFFDLAYQETIRGLYGDPAVSSLLGYEGSSVEHGGYLERGFDDISWLPTDESVAK
jgi:hypothetical protein